MCKKQNILQNSVRSITTKQRNRWFLEICIARNFSRLTEGIAGDNWAMKRIQRIK